MNLKQCVFYNFGYKLNDAELQKLIDWYQKTGQYKNKAELYSHIISFLVETFPGKTVYIKHEDTSDITLLLVALDNAIKK